MGDLSIVAGALGSGQVGVAYQAVVKASGGTDPLRWSAQGLPPGLAIDGASGVISGTPSAAGSFSPVVTLTDAYDSSVTRTFALNVTSGSGSGGSSPAAKVPALSALKLSASRWLLGSKLASVSGTAKPLVKRGGVPVGTNFSFRLDAAARVTLEVRHTAVGRRVSGKCVARKPGNASKPRCTRTLTDGALRVQGRSGNNVLHFEGRISSVKKLKPGAYQRALQRHQQRRQDVPAKDPALHHRQVGGTVLTRTKTRAAGLARSGGALAAFVVAIGLFAGASVGTAAPGGASGTLLAFGLNNVGQLGSATNNGTANATPTPAAVTLPGEIGAVERAAVGGNHSLVVTSSGQLYSFGYNVVGQLGRAAGSTPSPVPTLVTLPGQIGSITLVAAGTYHSLSATSSGQLYAFGYNLYGQLGVVANSGTSAANPTPMLVGLPGAIGVVAQIAAGDSHSLALTSSGQLYAFGSNAYGQLGIAANSGMATPNPTPTLVGLPGAIGAITQIAAGDSHSLVLTSSGQLYAFGLNASGALGSTTNNGTINANPIPTPVTLPGATGSVAKVAGGGSYTLALTSTGQLYAFGNNYYGQLGSPANNGTNNANATPTQVALPGQVGSITLPGAGGNHSLVVTSSGQIYAFGSNTYGQLGSATNNSTANANPTPTLVAFNPAASIDTAFTGSTADHSLVLVGDLSIVAGVLGSGQVGVAYQAAVKPSGGTDPLRWSAQGLPPGLAIDGASGVISGTPSAPGNFSPVVTLTDAYDSSVTRTFALSVTSASGSGGAPSAKAPALTALKQSASRWLLGSKLASVSATAKRLVKRGGVPVGTNFSFKLDAAARVSLVFRHTAIGRRVSGKCVARKPGNAGKPRCTRTLTDGTLRVQGRSGSNVLHFEGRISSVKKLKAGAYSVLITAISSAGKTSPAKTLRFTIAR